MSQKAVMQAMLVIAVISLPLMLLVNPCVNSKKKVADEDEVVQIEMKEGVEADSAEKPASRG